MATTEFTLTEFLQHSGKVLLHLSEGEVVLRRRDGDDLVLTTRANMDALLKTLSAFMAMRDGGRERVASVLPWIGFLNAEDQQSCLRELDEAATVALTSGRLSQLDEVFDEWRATGLASWDERRLRERADADEYNQTDLAQLQRPNDKSDAA